MYAFRKKNNSYHRSILLKWMQKILIILMFISLLNYSFQYQHHQVIVKHYNKDDTQTAITMHEWIQHKILEELSLTHLSEYRSKLHDNDIYRFRYLLNTTQSNHQLMILIDNEDGNCSTYLRFPTHRRLLKKIKSNGLSILVICSARGYFNFEQPIESNSDVRNIYLSIQRWMNEVYFKNFDCYPRVFISGIGQGAIFASFIARILPTQGLMLTYNNQYRQILTTQSNYSVELQRRIILDPVFANWFYFDFCYRQKRRSKINYSRCPFRNASLNFGPTPPIFFVAFKNDRTQSLKKIYSLRRKILKHSIENIPEFFTMKQTIQTDILRSQEISPDYMTKSFDLWQNKTHLSRIFYKYIKQLFADYPKTSSNGTCSCIGNDLTLNGLAHDALDALPQSERDEELEYFVQLNYLREYLCVEICGDILAIDGLNTRFMDTALQWIKLLDEHRFSVQAIDYTERPIRIWMYPKQWILKDVTTFTDIPIDWKLVETSTEMYAAESLISDYYNRAQYFPVNSSRPMITTKDVLLADYFLVPNNLAYLYFYFRPNQIGETEFEIIRTNLTDGYFGGIMNNVINRFPFWSIAQKKELFGMNHVIPFISGRNMGTLKEKIHPIFKNVIQICSTGFRFDLWPSTFRMPFSHHQSRIVYRHGYDIVVPQYTRLRLTGSVPDEKMVFESKKRLLYFAGSLHHAVSYSAPRARLSRLWATQNEMRQQNVTTMMDGKLFEIINIFQGHMDSEKYIRNVYESIFLLCPEGFLPWSPRVYEAIQMRAVPLILSDHITLPFERFIDWESISAKVNSTNVENLTEIVRSIVDIRAYTERKLKAAMEHFTSCRWPYISVNNSGIYKHVFVSEDDQQGTARNPFYYLSLELRCRRLEQHYGLRTDVNITNSDFIKSTVCENYSDVCPCPNSKLPIYYRQYF